jgi:hypothetical protein
MSVVRFLGGAILFLLVTGVGLAQTPTAPNAQITADEVKVYSGPADNFYPTSLLHKGDKVLVLRREESGWLAIAPPPGSFSWINSRDVEFYKGHYLVKRNPEAPLRVGSLLLNQPPTVERTSVKTGTILTVINKPETGPDGSTWLPVMVSPSELRYLRPEGVAALTTVAPPEPPHVVGSTPSRPVVAAPVSYSAGKNPLLVEAEAAEKNGDLLSAIRIYDRLAKDSSQTDYNFSLECLNRSQVLRSRLQGMSSSTQPTPPVDNGNRLVATPANSLGQTASLTPRQGQPNERDSSTTVRLSPPILHPATQQPQANWYGPGHLYRTGFQVDGKTAYGLMSQDCKWHLYLTAGPGLNLDQFRERNVKIYGSVIYRSELRTHYMIVQQVYPEP